MGEVAGYLLDLPVTPYARAHALQLAIVKARAAKQMKRDVVILLEHAPVFTLGRRGSRENLLASPEVLKAHAIEVVPVERGGDITYHGPGQLVAYVLMDLQGRRIGVRDFVAALEQAMVRTAAHWGVGAQGDETNRGAWIGRRKLGSVGITVRRGVSFHGLAMNISTDLAPFAWINPCGLTSCRMTTLEKEAGQTIGMRAARRQMARHLSGLLDVKLEPVEFEKLKGVIDEHLPQKTPLA